MTNSLRNNLVAYWGLDEASGANDALDKHSGARTLTQYNSPGAATGKVYSTARSFDGYTSRPYFSRASETALQGGDNDYTIAAWVYLNTVSANHVIVSKWESDSEYLLMYNYNDTDFSSTSRWIFFINSSGWQILQADNAGAASANTWYLVVCWYNATNDTMGISINDGTPDTKTSVGAGETGTDAFRIGNFVGGAYYPNARIGPIAMWKSTAGNGGVLTSTQRTQLYNSGAGLTYASFDTGSGTTYNSSPSGGLTPSGAILRNPRKVFAGGITPAGVILRNPRKTIAGSVTPTGAPTKRTSKTFAGGLTPSGVLTAVKTALVSVAGAITPSGALIRSTAKTLAGSVTPTGAAIKSTAKTFAGALTPTGAALKQATRTAAGALTPTGALLKQAGKVATGSITPTGAMFRQAGKTLSGAITPTGATIRSIGKILAGALTPSGGLSSSKSNSAPTIVSGYTEAGNASNSTTLVINTPTHANGDKIYIVYVTDADSPTTASVSGSGWTTLEGPQDVSSSSVSTAGVMYVWYKTAASEGASYTITASNSERAVAIAFAVHGDNGIDAEATYASGTDTSAEVGAVTTTVANTLRISVVVSQGVRTVSTLTGHTLLATHSYTSAGTVSVQYKAVASAGSDAGQTATLDTGGWGSHAWAIKPSTGTNYTASLSGALAPAGAIIRSARKTVAGSITPTGAVLKRAAKTFAGTLTPTGAAVKRTAKTFIGALTPVGSIAKRIGKVLSGVLGLAGSLVGFNPNDDRKVDVTLTDAAVTTCSLVDAAVTTVTLADSAVTTLTISDTSHE